MSSPRRDAPIVHPGGPSLQGPHRVEAFGSCPQLEALAHELHLRPVIEKLPTKVGTLVHAGLAYRYAAMLSERPDWFVYRDGYEAIAVLGADRPEFCDLAMRIFAAYEQHYAVNTWQPVLVEHQFVVQFANGEPYSARTDLLAVEAGEYVLIDHKTVGKVAASLGASYAADRQMLTGLAIARACGYDVRRVVINAMSREMPVPTFRRFDVPISDVAFARLGSDTAYYLERMKEVRVSHPDPLNRPRNWGACMRKYGQCDFFDFCTGRAGLEQYQVPDEYKNGREKAGT